MQRRRLLVVLAAAIALVGMLGSAGGAHARHGVGSAPTTTTPAISSPRTTLPTVTPPNLPPALTPTTGALPIFRLPPAAPIPNLAAVQARLVQVGTLNMPLAMATRTLDPVLYFAEKGGRVRTLDGRPILDLSREVSEGDERGLLGLVFSPDGTKMYVDFTDLAGTIHVVEFAFRKGAPDLRTRREVLTIPHPLPVHNGGHLAFGPDRLLYIGVGDGGGYGDPANNAQNLGVLYGKILRIDPRPSGGKAYTIPTTNPFATRKGARPEIWAWGLRNPWRFSFDSTTGNMWIGDVGQDRWEEVDFQLAASTGGANYGWARMEGSHPFYGPKPAGAVDPIYEYPHLAGACAVTGGYVYRGKKISGLGGTYLFGDFCVGNVTAVLEAAGKLLGVKPLGISLAGLTSFGQDANGEIYALSLYGPIFRIDPA